MKKAVSWFSDKKIAAAAGVVFVLSLIPILYLAGYARPTGDDYGYSIYTHAAWLDTHSLTEVLKAAVHTVQVKYMDWNGDWFTVFLFSLMPEVFVPYSFFIVPYIMIGAVVLATYVFLDEILVKTVGMRREYTILFSSLILLVTYQFIPSTAVGMYWYVGAVHYMLPHAAALLALVFGMRYYRTQRIRYIVYASLCMLMVGGSSYFSSLLVFMVYAVMMVLLVRKRRSILWLALPFLIGAAGFIVQCISPGNKVRGGEAFGLHGSDAVMTIVRSLINGVMVHADYLRDKTFIYVIFLLCAFFGWSALLKAENSFRFRYPVLFVFFMYSVYSAMYAPAIYSGVDVSLGPDTMVYITFLLTGLLSILYAEGWAVRYLREKGGSSRLTTILLSEEEFRLKAAVPLMAAALLLTVCSAGSLGKSVDKQVYDYVSSGQADDFRAQIRSQMDILLDASVKEAYLVPINDEQGPLLHMPVTEDENAFTNWVVKEFYRKDRVVMKKDN